MGKLVGTSDGQLDSDAESLQCHVGHGPCSDANLQVIEGIPAAVARIDHVDHDRVINWGEDAEEREV